MKILLAVLSLATFVLYSGTANSSTYTAKSTNGDSITLYGEPCQLGGWFKNWRKAVLFWHGKQYDACWRSIGGYAAVIDSEGDLSPVPVGAFVKDETI